jgi:transposase
MASMHDGARSKTTVYAAIELSKKSWVVAIARPDRDRPSIHRIAGGNLADPIGRLRKAAGEKQRIVVCYEAGYDGFWLARSLAKIGIDCRVLDPASIQVNRRARRVKTDRIDSLALLRALIAIDRGERHVCAVVRVPTVEEEDARRSHRERQRLVRERTGISTASRGCSSLRAFGGSSRSGGALELISVNWPPPRACGLPSACVVNLNGNTSASS